VWHPSGSPGDAVQSLQEKEALAKLQGTSTSSSGGAAAGAGPGGRLQALIDTVVGNLELRISNIHIRYEDPVSNPGQFFAIGLLLEEVSAHTVDERGRRAFVSSDALLTLRKVRGRDDWHRLQTVRMCCCSHPSRTPPQCRPLRAQGSSPAECSLATA
jgi:hypothetical protein